MASNSEDGYNVVFRRTAGACQGIITQNSYPSREFFTEETKNDEREVIAEGVRRDEAIALARTTPVECYFLCAVHKAKNAEGKVSLSKLRQDIEALMLVLEYSSQCVP